MIERKPRLLKASEHAKKVREARSGAREASEGLIAKVREMLEFDGVPCGNGGKFIRQVGRYRRSFFTLEAMKDEGGNIGVSFLNPPFVRSMIFAKDNWLGLTPFVADAHMSGKTAVLNDPTKGNGWMEATRDDVEDFGWVADALKKLQRKADQKR